jgi:hypothetical protein
MISSCHYLFDCKNLIPKCGKLRQATSIGFTIQSLSKDEWGITALLHFARNIGLGYYRIVRCRSIPLDKDAEKMNEGQWELGFNAFDY